MNPLCLGQKRKWPKHSSGHRGYKEEQNERDLISLEPEHFRVECHQTSALGHHGLRFWIHPNSGFHILLYLHIWPCPQGTGA